MHVTINNTSILIDWVWVEVKLQATVSRPVCVDVGPSFGAHAHISFIAFSSFQYFLVPVWGANTEERTVIKFALQ
jgi:hypothetical protein